MAPSLTRGLWRRSELRVGLSSSSDSAWHGQGVARRFRLFRILRTAAGTCAGAGNACTATSQRGSAPSGHPCGMLVSPGSDALASTCRLRHR